MSTIDSPLNTRFAQYFGLKSPIVAAPMALASGGLLAASVANAGGLGLIGGGYGDLEWVKRETEIAWQTINPLAVGRLGIGFISWTLEKDSSALDWVLSLPSKQRPSAIFLSFAASREAMLAQCKRIREAGIPLIFQIQTISQLPDVLESGADVIVAQGSEAGGHGMNALEGRATFTLVPELADQLASKSPETMLLAAGGVADGRGLAAALMLGADGVVIGSKFWASKESLAAAGAKDAAIRSDGDGTARTAIFDILRRKNWPVQYDFRALRNSLHRTWEGRVQELRTDPEEARAAYDAGVAAKDYSRAHATVGEATALIHESQPAPVVFDSIHQQALELMAGKKRSTRHA
jgi:nitronate monooxygenase